MLTMFSNKLKLKTRKVKYAALFYRGFLGIIIMQGNSKEYKLEKIKTKACLFYLKCVAGMIVR